MSCLRLTVFLALVGLILCNVCPPNADPEFTCPLNQCTAPKIPTDTLQQCPEYQDFSCCSSDDTCEIGVYLSTQVKPSFSSERCAEYFRVRECGLKCSPRQREFVSQVQSNTTFFLCSSFCVNMWLACKDSTYTDGVISGLVSNIFTPETLCKQTNRPDINLQVVIDRPATAIFPTNCFKGTIDPNPRYSYVTDVRPTLVGDPATTTLTLVNDLGIPVTKGGMADKVSASVTNNNNAALTPTIFDQNDGSYVAEYTPNVAGPVRIIPQINNVPVFGSPFISYAVSRSNCSVLNNQPSQKPYPQLSLCSWYDQNACCSRDDTDKLRTGEWYEGILATYGSVPACVARLEEIICGPACSPAPQTFINFTLTSGSNFTSAPDQSTTRGTFFVCDSYCTSLFQACQDVILVSGLNVKVTFGTSVKFCQANNPYPDLAMQISSNACFSGRSNSGIFPPTSRLLASDLCLFAGEQGSLKIQAVDINLVDLDHGVSGLPPFTSHFFGPVGYSPANAVDNKDGTFTIPFSLTAAGIWNVRVTDPTGTQDILNSPVRIQINPGPAAASTSSIGSVPTNLGIGQTAKFDIIARDLYGNQLTKGGDDFYGTVTGPVFASVVVTDSCNGYYHASFTPTASGLYTISIYLGPTLMGTFNINVGGSGAGQPSAIKSFAFGPGLGPRVVFNTRTNFTIVTQDQYGNRVLGEFPYDVVLTNPAGYTYPGYNVSSVIPYSGTNLTIQYMGGGMYQVTYVPTWVGPFLIHIALSRVNIDQSPFYAVSINPNEIPTDCQFYNYCNGNGACVNGVCQCYTDPYGLDTYKGPDCSGSPSPQIAVVKFTNAGNRITVLFNVPTNRANLYGEFNCSKLITDISSLGEASYCSWHNSSNLLIFLGADSTATVGSPLTFDLSSLTAKDGTPSKSGTHNIKRPDVYPVPVPRIVGPTSIPFCYHLTLDATLSYGGGGKPLIYHWSVSQSAFQSIPGLANLSSTISSTTDPVLQLPILSPGLYYTFSLTVENFFGVTSTITAHHTVFVQSANQRGPMVIIRPSQLNISGAEDLTLFGRVLPSVKTCIAAGLSETEDTEGDYWYSWVRLSGPPFDIDVQSANTKDLFIPANTLATGFSYELQLRAVHKRLNSIRGDAVITINVVPTPSILVLSGASTRAYVSNDRPLNLDASKSILKDSPFSPFNYRWNCTVLPRPLPTIFAALPDQPCFDEALRGLVLPNSEKVGVLAGNLGLGIYRLSVALSPSNSVQRSTGYTTVWTGAGNIDVAIDISSVSAAKPASTSQTLSFVGASSPDGNFSYSWTVLTENLNLSDSRLLRTASAQTPYLVIPPGVLASGETYKFQLTATSQNGLQSGFAQVEVTSNERPNAGSCEITPQFGNPSSTPFYIICTNWEDDLEDQPLQYNFFFEANGQKSPLTGGKSFANDLWFTLPAAVGNVVAEISDKNGATATYKITTGIAPRGGYVTINNASLDSTLLIPRAVEETPEEKANRTLTELQSAVKKGDNNAIASLITDICNTINQSPTDAVQARTDIRTILSSILVNSLNLPDTADAIVWRINLLRCVTQNPQEIVASAKSNAVQYLYKMLVPVRLLKPTNPSNSFFGDFYRAVSTLYLANNSQTTKNDALLLRRTLSNLVPTMLSAINFGEPRLFVSAPSIVSRTHKIALKDLIIQGTITGESVQFQLDQSVLTNLESEGFTQIAYQLIEFKDNVYNYSDSPSPSTKVGTVIGSLQLYDIHGNALQVNGPVTISFVRTFEVKNNLTCAFVANLDLDPSGTFSDRQCQLTSVTNELLTCSCAHLTDFAVLSDVKASGFIPINPSGDVSTVQISLGNLVPSKPWIDSHQALLICLTGGFGLFILFLSVFLYRHKREKISSRTKERQLLEQAMQQAAFAEIEDDSDFELDDMNLDNLIRILKEHGRLPPSGETTPSERKSSTPPPLPREVRAYCSRLLGLANKNADDSGNIRTTLGTVEDWEKRYPSFKSSHLSPRHKPSYTTSDDEDAVHPASAVVAIPTGFHNISPVVSPRAEMVTSVKTTLPGDEYATGLKVERKTLPATTATATSRTMMNMGGSDVSSEEDEEDEDGEEGLGEGEEGGLEVEDDLE